MTGKVLKLPHAVDAPADSNCAGMIELLQDTLAEVREGKFASLAIVAEQADGSGISTKWHIPAASASKVITALAVLQHDIIASSRGG